MVKIIAVKQGEAIVNIGDLGNQEVPGSGQITLTDLHGLGAIYGSADLKTEINADTILLNDGSGDFTKQESLDFLAPYSAGMPQILTNGGRFTQKVQSAADNISGQAGTYNSIVCAAAEDTVLGSKFYNKSFDDTIEEAVVLNFVLPDNYEDGTDIDLTFAWAAVATTGDVRWQCGIAKVTAGEDYSAASETYATPVDITVPGTQYDRADKTFTFTGSSLVKGDVICVIIFRDANNAADTATGDALINFVSLECINNTLGGTV